MSTRTRPSAFLASLAIHISGFSQFTLALSTTGAQTSALTTGLYDIRCSSDCYIKVGSTASDVTTSTGYLVPANTTLTVFVPDTQRIGGILASATATMIIHRVG